jgi:formyl-CoA transferase
VYRTRDGAWLVVSGTTDPQVARLLPLLGLDTPEGRDRFGTVASRAHHGDELDRIVAEWIASLDRAEVVQRLLAARIPVAPVNTVADLVHDPHVVARGDFVEVEDPALGSVRMVAPLPRLSATPAEIRWSGPPLGAHTDEVYAEWLGLSSAELDALRRKGAI